MKSITKNGDSYEYFSIDQQSLTRPCPHVTRQRCGYNEREIGNGKELPNGKRKTENTKQKTWKQKCETEIATNARGKTEFAYGVTR